MKNIIIELTVRYKVYILTTLLFITLFRSCLKTTEIKKLNVFNENKTLVIDSLNFLNIKQKNIIEDIPEIIRVEKIKVHVEYDNWISEKDRGQQLMELHKIVKNNLKNLE